MRTIGRHTGRAVAYIGRHRSLFVIYIDSAYTPRHGAGVWDVAA